MGITNDIKQKVTGEIQKTKGEAEMKSGKKLQGAWDKTKGAVNSTIADTNLKARAENGQLDQAIGHIAKAWTCTKSWSQ